MKVARVPTAVLWTANAALAAAIVAGSFNHLFFRAAVDPLQAVEPPEPPGPTQAPAPRPNWSSVQDFGNPVVPREAAAPAEAAGLPAELLGTLPSGDPAWAVAYLWIRPRNAYVNAYVATPVCQDGLAVPELAGWKLVRVDRDSALFAREGEERELRIKDAPLLSGSALPPADRSKLKPTRVTAAGNAETYTVDKAGAAWAAENADALLRDVVLQDYPGGGIQIQSIAPGSPLADFGFQAGDVIKVVNGQVVASSLSIPDLKNNGALSKGQIVVQFERAGMARTMTVTGGR